MKSVEITRLGYAGRNNIITFAGRTSVSLTDDELLDLAEACREPIKRINLERILGRCAGDMPEEKEEG